MLNHLSEVAPARRRLSDLSFKARDFSQDVQIPSLVPQVQSEQMRADLDERGTE
jgi:hypothetical protein